jgi:hypothetical protein
MSGTLRWVPTGITQEEFMVSLSCVTAGLSTA